MTRFPTGDVEIIWACYKSVFANCVASNGLSYMKRVGFVFDW
jgi:hypothetical protein